MEDVQQRSRSNAPSKTKAVFFLLIVFQTLHSIEEYYYSLWEVLAPARFISLLINENVVVGFVTINVSIVLFGFWTYFYPLSHRWRTMQVFLWFWILLELGNGIAHVIFAIQTRGYFPGIYSAPLLLALSCYLGIKQLQSSNVSSAA